MGLDGSDSLGNVFGVLGEGGFFGLDRFGGAGEGGEVGFGVLELLLQFVLELQVLDLASLLEQFLEFRGLLGDVGLDAVGLGLVGVHDLGDLVDPVVLFAEVAGFGDDVRFDLLEGGIELVVLLAQARKMQQK